MKRWANDIGPNMRRIRIRMGLTQEQFAAKLQIKESDMTRQVVANLESRRRRAYESHIRQIIKVSHCTLDELFFGTTLVINRQPTNRSKRSRH